MKIKKHQSIKYIRKNENEKSVGVEHDGCWLQKLFFIMLAIYFCRK